MDIWMKRFLIGLVILMIVGLVGYRFLTPAEFRAQANPAPVCQSAAFDKSALVFDTLLICGTNQVSAEKLTHAANVAAEWLDNDEDGQVDEPRLLTALKENNPVVLMTGSGISARAIPTLLPLIQGRSSQDLSAAETNPAGERRDASQEEIHHIIMNAGWIPLFPATFSDQANQNSTLYQAWKIADDNQHYVYNDPTCNDSCKVTEFVYLATAAYMETGAEKDLASDEMRLNTRAELGQAIPSVIEIFESNEYLYPTNHWPDGTYPFPANIEIYDGP